MRRRLAAISIILCMLIGFTGCGDTKMYASGKDGYTTVDFVDGISFDVVSSIARNATAITNMSSEMTYEVDQTYLYKDGGQSYFIFNMSSLVCIAQKGTTFHFSGAGDVKEALENDGNILGVWFDCPKRKARSRDESKDGVYKCIVDANAQVSLTPEIYSDFTGQLATIENGNEEWALFIGTIGSDGYEKLDKDMQKTIAYMVESLSLYEKPEAAAEEAPPVSLGGENEAAADEESAEKNADSSTPGATASPTELPTATQEVEEDVKEEPMGAATEIPEEPVEVVESIEVEEILEETETPMPTVAPTETPTAVTEPTVEPSPIKEGRPQNVKQYINQNNQKKIVLEDNAVYTTDIYSMLETGKKAKISLLDVNGASEGVIKVDTIITGRDAEKLIEGFCKNGTVSYGYFAPPDGCSWNVVHYTLEEGSGYIDVKLRGLDGENLKFRGIEYSQRSYDIKVSDTEFYSYYAVPNACPEYALEIGEGTINNDLLSGYYHIAR